MIRTYFKIAWRNLLQQKSLSLINIGGLSVGLACFTLFLLFAIHEFNYDRFHKNGDNIFRVVEWYQGFPGREPAGDAYGGMPAGPALKREFGDVVDFARLQIGFDQKLIRANGKTLRSAVSFADPELFSMFSFEVLDGQADALKDQRNIVLTRDKAIELFGTDNVIGQRVEIKNTDEFEPFQVGAVVENIPSNSTISFGIVSSISHFLSTSDGVASANNWHMSMGGTTYVRLREDSKLMSQPGRLAQFRKKYYPGEEQDLRKDGLWKDNAPAPVSFRLQPLKEVHTETRISGMGAGMDPKYIWILIAISSGILLIACINFTTLAIGRSAGRAREVGVRKVMGGQRTQLVYQFLTESFLMTLLSAGFAIFLAWLLLPFFNKLSGIPINFSIDRFPQMISWLAVLVTVTGLIAGIYPALVLSGFAPIEVLKSKVRLGGSNYFTKSLVTFQFVLSITLIISTVIILQQLGYMRSRNIGFNRDNIVIVDAQGADGEKIYPLFRQQLQGSTAVAGISASEMGMGEGNGLMGYGFLLNGDTKGVIVYPVDSDFIPVLGMQMLAGRNFDSKLSIDTSGSVIVNETLLRDFGISLQNAIGSPLMERRFDGSSITKTIIGVTRNFNFSKLTENIRPQIFTYPPKLYARKFYVRIKSGDPAAGLAAITSAWKNVAKDLPLQYSFLDDDFNRFYLNEQRWSRVVGCAGVICIFLGCLGLLGLASLAAANRTKEIGIRKILGASVSSIVTLISKDFLKLVVIALIIAIPIAWWGMSKWLQEYAYRINISLWVFLLTGMLAIIIAFVTVGIRSMFTAKANPTKSLRTE